MGVGECEGVFCVCLHQNMCIQVPPVQERPGLFVSVCVCLCVSEAIGHHLGLNELM